MGVGEVCCLCVNRLGTCRGREEYVGECSSDLVTYLSKYSLEQSELSGISESTSECRTAVSDLCVGLQVPEVQEVATCIQHCLCSSVQEDRHLTGLLFTHQLQTEEAGLKCDIDGAAYIHKCMCQAQLSLVAHLCQWGGGVQPNNSIEGETQTGVSLCA